MRLTTVNSFIFITLLCFSSLLYAGNISKQQAAESAQQVHAGRVLSVKLKKSFYRVKILNAKGQVRVVRVNAKNGKTRQ